MPEATEEAIRGLAKLNFTTRQIAEQVGISQSTVVRKLRKINTGPQPVFREKKDGAEVLQGDWPTRPQAVISEAVLQAPPFRVAGPGWHDIPPPREPASGQAPRGSLIAAALCLLAAALSLMAAAVLFAALRTERSRAPAPAVTAVQPASATCVRYTGAHHYISAIMVVPAATCPVAWTKVTNASR